MIRFKNGFRFFMAFVAVVFAFNYVDANKSKNFQFSPPTNFVVEDSFFLPFSPTEYHYNGSEKISIIIPPEIKSNLGAPKTKSGEINPEFIQGKKDFNEQFGIKDWKMDSYKFSQTAFGERLEIEGSYVGFGGDTIQFVEHHYSSPKLMQSIHLFFPAGANKKVVSQARSSLQTFNPNIN